MAKLSAHNTQLANLSEFFPNLCYVHQMAIYIHHHLILTLLVTSDAGITSMRAVAGVCVSYTGCQVGLVTSAGYVVQDDLSSSSTIGSIRKSSGI